MLARKQEPTIAALLTQRNLDEAAKAAGISTRTLMRWLKLPEFQAAYREARRTVYSQAVAKLQQGATAAATTLLKVMLRPGHAGVRESAGRGVRHEPLWRTDWTRYVAKNRPI